MRESLGQVGRMAFVLCVCGCFVVPWWVKPSGKAPISTNRRIKKKTLIIAKMRPPWWTNQKVPQVALWYANHQTTPKAPSDWKSFQDRLMLRLHGGDWVQFRYITPRAAHLMAFGVTSSGKVRLYLSDGHKKSVPIQKGTGTLPLKPGLRVTRGTGIEGLFIAMSNKPFGLDTIFRRVMFLFHRHKQDLRRFPKRWSRWWLRPILIERMAPISRPSTQATSRPSGR